LGIGHRKDGGRFLFFALAGRLEETIHLDYEQPASSVISIIMLIIITNNKAQCNVVLNVARPCP
jgi:hypothetical protein